MDGGAFHRPAKNHHDPLANNATTSAAAKEATICERCSSQSSPISMSRDLIDSIKFMV
jgi:hypothetical protein